MPYLEILHLTGEIERRELSKTQPVSIGRLASNDIVIDEDEVERIHARISWNKEAYEIVAAGVDGVDVDGTLVQHAVLQGDETLRFGTVDVRFRDGGARRKDSAPAPDEARPPASASVRPGVSAPATGPVSASSPGGAARPRRDTASTMNEPRPDVNWDALQALAAESQSAPAENDEREAAAPAAPRGASAAAARETPPRDTGGREKGARSESRSPPATGERKGAGDAKDESEAAVTQRLRQALRHSQVRPGQEDTARSPLVLGLGGGAALLVLIGFIFHFMINRQTTEEEFSAAKALYDENKYANAAVAFSDFVVLHPHHELTEQAMIYRGMAEVDQVVKTRKDYADGLEKLRSFINAFQDYDEFEAQRPFVAERARLVALEAAQAAGRTKMDDLLRVSDEARTVFTTYAAQDVKPQERIAQIEEAKRAAQAEILRYRTQGSATLAIDAALGKQDVLTAIAAWRNLVGRYDELRRDAKIAVLLKKILDAEQARVRIEEQMVAAETTDLTTDVPASTTFIFHARSSTEEVSGGRCVLALAKDTCYGVDTITGEPVWRRVIGLDTPFFPVIDSATGTAVLFDTRTNELVKIDVNNGQLIWRTALKHRASAAPLLAAGRLLAPTEGGRLYEVNFGDGSVRRRVQFSQPISAPALFPSGERVVVAGDQELFYVLNLASLECERVQYLGDGHPAGSIRAPLLPMGPYLLVCENISGNETCQLQVLDATQSSGELVEVATANVTGLVVDPPVIRGQDLFVPSTGERVSVFTVSNTPGQPILSTGPVYPGAGNSTAPIFLSTGPERQVWLASSAVRRLQVTGDELRAAQKPEAVGTATQPLQYVERRLFHGRRRAYTSAVTFTRMDRETLVSDTQAVLGAGLLAWSAADRGHASLILANEAGIVFRTTPARWTNGGLQTTDAERLPLNEDLSEPIAATALDKGQLAVAAGGPEPKIWILNSIGKIDRSVPLTAGPQGPLAALSARVLVPLQGRLKLASITSGQSNVEDFTLPTDEMPTARWRFIAAVNETDVVAALASGDVLLVRYQTTPRHFLGQVARISLGAPIHVRGDSAGSDVVLADGESRVHLLDAASLSARGSRQFEQPVSNQVFLAGDWVFAETGGRELQCLKRDESLATVWTLPLDGSALAGRPLPTPAGLLVPLQDGRVLIVNPDDGAVSKTIATGQRLAAGPLTVGDDLFVPGVDGSLVRLTTALK